MFKKSKPKPKARPSNISSHAYSPETRQLTVTFGSGSQYRYDDVPESIAKEFCDCKSQGRFLHSHVIGKFTHTRIDKKPD